MKNPQLDDRIRRNLGEEVKVFAEPQKLYQIMAIMGSMLLAFVMIGYFDGSIKPEHMVFFIVGLPIVLGITYFVGQKTQFQAPYLAVGRRGVAFPLACRDVIPWSNIDSIRCYSEVTFHGRHREDHVAIALKLKSGALTDYSPTLRSRIPYFGYQSYFSNGVLLLSTIYCSLSPDEVFEILASDWRKANEEPALASRSTSALKGLKSTGAKDGSSVSSVPLVARSEDPPRHFPGRGLWHYACYSLIILAMALITQSGKSESFDWIARPQLPHSLPETSNGMLARDTTRLTQEAARLLTANDVEGNLRRAVELYREAADLGDAEAMNSLGLIYAEGDVSVRDPKSAYDWFKRAAEAGYSDGIANLGWVHQEGIGVDKNYNLAYSWFLKAAELGNDEAMNRLGLLHVDGLGTDKDPVAAMGFFEKAAEKNNANAINNLGWLYRDAIGVPQNFAKARSFFERAAEMANEVGAWSLSVMMDEGKGGPFDPKGAALRLLQAAKAGQPDATKELAGTMEYWQVSTRIEVKALLASQGFYSGPVDDIWDDRARVAASRVVSHGERRI